MIEEIFESCRKVNEDEDLDREYAVFGYDAKDVPTYEVHYETKEEATAAALDLAEEVDGKDLAFVEVWQANDKGEFGVGAEGSELIWKSDEPGVRAESKQTNGEKKDEN